MDSRRSGAPAIARNACSIGRRLAAAAGLSALMLWIGGAKADAQPVHFRYVGGHWSHSRHSGWHRYWGGPSIGFYYAPSPVYVVPGYSDPTYYTGPDYWTSNPSFGLSINTGGYYSGGRAYHSDSYYRSHDRNWQSGDNRYHRSSGQYQRSDHNYGSQYQRGDSNSGRYQHNDRGNRNDRG